MGLVDISICNITAKLKFCYGCNKNIKDGIWKDMIEYNNLNNIVKKKTLGLENNISKSYNKINRIIRSKTKMLSKDYIDYSNYKKMYYIMNKCFLSKSIEDDYRERQVSKSILESSFLSKKILKLIWKLCNNGQTTGLQLKQYSEIDNKCVWCKKNGTP
jgi:hypothetical protein